jgi:histidine triad (HIT) family protein
MSENDTIFGKILRGEIPCRKVFEDEEFLAFHDIHPIAEVHFLIIPKKFIPTLAHASADDAPLLGRMLALVPRLAQEQGLGDGFRTAINTGKQGRQDVYHLHVHVFGNRPGSTPLRVMLGQD